MRGILALWVIAMATLAGAEPETPAPKPVTIEKLCTGFRFTEGPAIGPDGAIYFTDIPNQRIHRFDPKTSKTTVARENSGRANGLMFDAEGKLIACEGGGRRVVRIDGEKVAVLADKFGDKKLNSPNDLAIDADGGIYFTDPRYGKHDDRELEFEGVYYRATDGTISRVAKNVVKPNGILLRADGKALYVADSKRKLLVSYGVQGPGKLTNGRIFARLDATQRGGPDGMARDKASNVYCAGQGHVWIWDRRGKLLEKIKMPEGPANVLCVENPTWTLYVTARTSLYRVQRATANTAKPK